MTVTLWFAWGALAASHAALWMVVRLHQKTIAIQTSTQSTQIESIKLIMSTLKSQESMLQTMTDSIRILSRGRPL